MHFVKWLANYKTYDPNTNEPPDLKKEILIYIKKIINLITLKNIFAQFGLNLIHSDHKSMPKVKQHRLAHPKTN